MDKLGPYLLGPNDENQGIYTGDARELAKAIPDESIDLIITDPPYFLPAQSYVGTRRSGYTRSLADTSILNAYFNDVFDQIGRVLKPTGSLYLFCDAQSYPVFYVGAFPYFTTVKLIIWDKQTSYNGYTWRHQHELIMWASGKEAPPIPTGDGDILRCRAVPVDERIHPAEKPLFIAYKIIDKHGGAGVVLDLFSGGGFVPMASKQLGRRWLAFEIDPDTAELARKRVRETQPPLFVPQPEQMELAV